MPGFSWILLAAAIVLEVCGTTCMKLSHGFSRPVPSVLVFVFYVMAFTALTFAVKVLDISLAYAIWAGVGTALIALLGVFLFGERLSPVQWGCIALIIVGVVGLKAGENATPLAASPTTTPLDQAERLPPSPPRATPFS